MADPEKAVGNWALPITDPTCPLNTAAIWSEISSYMTTNEWATIAGTCRASWYAKLPRVALDPGTPLAGVLKKRCICSSLLSPVHLRAARLSICPLTPALK